jgi:hypothetical protein
MLIGERYGCPFKIRERNNLEWQQPADRGSERKGMMCAQRNLDTGEEG